MKKTPLFLILSLILGILGQLASCALPVEDSDDTEENGTPMHDLRSGKNYLINGTNDGGDGAVEVLVSGGGQCSGVMVGTQMVITASHCFNSWFGDNKAGWGIVPIKLSYAVTHDQWLCMGNGPAGTDGKCTTDTAFIVSRDKNDNIMGMRAAYDYAVILAGKWNNVTASDAASGLYTGSIKNLEYRVYGTGYYGLDFTGLGEMRSLYDTVDYVANEYFTTVADERQSICQGDSGGPYIRNNGWVFGVQSDGWIDDGCVLPGDQARASRITVNKVNTINFVRGIFGLNPCSQVSGYPDYWTCP